MTTENQNLKEIAYLACVVLAYMNDHSYEGIPDEIADEVKKHSELAEMVTTEAYIVSLAYRYLTNYAASEELLKEEV